MGTVFINSEINPNIFRTDELRNLHVPLNAQGNDFIDHDCFVDCSSIKERSFGEIRQLLSNDPECSKSIVSETTMEVIVQTIRNAVTISSSQKRKFGV